MIPTNKRALSCSVLLLWLARTANADQAIPVMGDPWPILLSGYEIPPQDPSWITDYSRFHGCRIRVTVTAESQVSTQVLECPETMAQACGAALENWRLAPADAQSTGSSSFVVNWVARYEQSLGLMTLHAELDPGHDAAFAGLSGPPGIQLVHHAEPTKKKLPKIPRKARSMGIQEATCAATFDVDPRGKPSGVEISDCPRALVEAATGAAMRWRFSPMVIDGMTAVDRVTEAIVFR